MIKAALKIPLILRLFCIFALANLVSCGGGSAGTGVEPSSKLFTGEIRDTANSPVSGVTVTILPTGDAGTSDNNGAFSIATSDVSGNVPVELRSETLNTTLTVPNVTTDASVVNLDITVDEKNNSAVISNVEVNAKIVGACDIYFENFETIRQANKVPTNGVTCTAKVNITGDGKTLGNAPFIIQQRRCPLASPWETIATGKTLSGTHSGTGQLDFRFKDDDVHCLYRVLAPVNFQNLKPVEIRILTLTKQKFDSKK